MGGGIRASPGCHSSRPPSQPLVFGVMMIQVQVQYEVVTVTVLEDWHAAQRQFRSAMSTSISIAGFSTTERPSDTALTATNCGSASDGRLQPCPACVFLCDAAARGFLLPHARSSGPVVTVRQTIQRNKRHIIAFSMHISAIVHRSLGDGVCGGTACLQARDAAAADASVGGPRARVRSKRWLLLHFLQLRWLHVSHVVWTDRLVDVYVPMYVLADGRR